MEKRINEDYISRDDISNEDLHAAIAMVNFFSQDQTGSLLQMGLNEELITNRMLAEFAEESAEE